MNCHGGEAGALPTIPPNPEGAHFCLCPDGMQGNNGLFKFHACAHFGGGSHKALIVAIAKMEAVLPRKCVIMTYFLIHTRFMIAFQVLIFGVFSPGVLFGKRISPAMAALVSSQCNFTRSIRLDLLFVIARFPTAQRLSGTRERKSRVKRVNVAPQAIWWKHFLLFSTWCMVPLW